MSPHTCKLVLNAHQSTGKILATKQRDTAGVFYMQGESYECELSCFPCLRVTWDEEED